MKLLLTIPILLIFAGGCATVKEVVLNENQLPFATEFTCVPKDSQKKYQVEDQEFNPDLIYICKSETGNDSTYIGSVRPLKTSQSGTMTFDYSWFSPASKAKMANYLIPYGNGVLNIQNFSPDILVYEEQSYMLKGFFETSFWDKKSNTLCGLRIIFSNTKKKCTYWDLQTGNFKGEVFITGGNPDPFKIYEGELTLSHWEFYFYRSFRNYWAKMRVNLSSLAPKKPPKISEAKRTQKLEEEKRQAFITELINRCLSFGFEGRKEIASCLQQEVFNEKRLARISKPTYSFKKQDEKGWWERLIEEALDPERIHEARQDAKIRDLGRYRHWKPPNH